MGNPDREDFQDHTLVQWQGWDKEPQPKSDSTGVISTCPSCNTANNPLQIITYNSLVIIAHLVVTTKKVNFILPACNGANSKLAATASFLSNFINYTYSSFLTCNLNRISENKTSNAAVFIQAARTKTPSQLLRNSPHIPKQVPSRTCYHPHHGLSISLLGHQTKNQATSEFLNKDLESSTRFPQCYLLWSSQEHWGIPDKYCHF